MNFYFDTTQIINELDKLADEEKLNFINKKLYMINEYYSKTDYNLWPLDVKALKVELEEKKTVYEKFNFDQIEVLPAQKIKWTGTEAQIIYLFQELVNAELLPKDLFTTVGEGYKLISQHFINKKGKSLKNTQLAQTYQNLRLNKKTKPIGADKIDIIVSKTKRHK